MTENKGAIADAVLRRLHQLPASRVVRVTVEDWEPITDGTYAHTVAAVAVGALDTEATIVTDLPRPSTLCVMRPDPIREARANELRKMADEVLGHHRGTPVDHVELGRLLIRRAVEIERGES